VVAHPQAETQSPLSKTTGHPLTIGFLFLLGAEAFNYTEWRFGRHNTGQMKARCFVKPAKLFVGALAAAGHYQHVKVDELAEVRLSSRRHDRLDQNELPSGRQSAMTVFHDGDRLFVVPVMYDPFHDDGVGAFRHGLEKISAHKLAAIGNT